MLGILQPSIGHTESASYSFVYCYGNAKIWVFIETNRTITVNPNEPASLFLTIYLEKLGNNVGVFLNRITFKLEGTQLEKIISPNITLQSDMSSWSFNITFEQDEISSILSPGQIINGKMLFELRYDIIDSSGEIWPFRVNEDFPISFKYTGQMERPWITFETIFIIVLFIGVISVLGLFWLKVRRYKKSHLNR